MIALGVPDRADVPISGVPMVLSPMISASVGDLLPGAVLVQQFRRYRSVDHVLCVLATFFCTAAAPLLRSAMPTPCCDFRYAGAVHRAGQPHDYAAISTVDVERHGFHLDG
jgi:hypothetical protein